MEKKELRAHRDDVERRAKIVERLAIRERHRGDTCEAIERGLRRRIEQPDLVERGQARRR